MDSREPAARLACHPRFEWREGMMLDVGERLGRESAAIGVAGDVRPDLQDPSTAGLIIDTLDRLSLLTDIVRVDDGWIVAIRDDEDVQGFHAESLGEAAAWALLAAWGEPIVMEAELRNGAWGEAN